MIADLLHRCSDFGNYPDILPHKLHNVNNFVSDHTIYLVIYFVDICFECVLVKGSPNDVCLENAKKCVNSLLIFMLCNVTAQPHPQTKHKPHRTKKLGET